uniref:MULE transposase domain-containing protein n=1 Tax=Lactuca sativa TaxID=4236 RepID=A0A9R1VP46_LACSA|nr:hypothetical protein LSAT_V11C400188510 [Lactuca sativa]
MTTVMDDLDMHDIENNHLDEENHQFVVNLVIFMDDLYMNDIVNKHYDEENHQFIFGDSKILHNKENQSKTQFKLQSDNVAAQYGSCKQFIGSKGSFFWILEVEASWIPLMGSFSKDIKDAINNCKHTNCNDFFAFTVIPSSSEVCMWRFKQQKYHKLINQDCMHLSRAKCQLDVVDQAFIHKLSSEKVGATTTYRLMCVIKGGYEFVDRLEKITRDINCHVWGTDANLLITKLQNRIVWCLYLLLEFIITKGASHLELSFLKCFGKAPIMVVTDQDPTIKKAIEIVLPHTRHRFCVWHIRSKLPMKVSWETINELDFKVNYNSIVWDSKIAMKDFEMRWDALMVDISYKTIIGFQPILKMYRCRESENSKFNRVSHHGYTLHNFMNAFESVMKRQRNSHIKFDFDTSTIIPIIKTPLEDMEKHASIAYTRNIILMVHREILHSLVSCSGVVSDICIVKRKKTVVEKKKVDINCEWDINTSEGDYEISDIQKILSINILKRLRRDIIQTTFLKRTFRYGDSSGNVEKDYEAKKTN